MHRLTEQSDVALPPQSFDPQPVVLESERIRLEPLDTRHATGLRDAGKSERVWQYLPTPISDSLDSATVWINGARAETEQGGRIAFAIIRRSDGRIAGSTSYLDIQRTHRTLGIGWTWLGEGFQRSFVNTECKFLLLEHAFDVLGALRVQFKTDRRNERSQTAIERIGARREGTLRNHMLVRGVKRDSVYFSIIDSEWTGSVRAHLRKLRSANHGPG